MPSIILHGGGVYLRAPTPPPQPPRREFQIPELSSANMAIFLRESRILRYLPFKTKVAPLKIGHPCPKTKGVSQPLYSRGLYWFRGGSRILNHLHPPRKLNMQTQKERPGTPSVLFFQATLPLKPATTALKIGYPWLSRHFQKENRRVFQSHHWIFRGRWPGHDGGHWLERSLWCLTRDLDVSKPETPPKGKFGKSPTQNAMKLGDMWC